MQDRQFTVQYQALGDGEYNVRADGQWVGVVSRIQAGEWTASAVPLHDERTRNIWDHGFGTRRDAALFLARRVPVALA